ncbi:hypothetical protein CAPTEDRAFT_226270 [Capitella teleta]|uniref:PRELI/MSF1 domain-containing protein n=1 Tax=Capitella teleta TaxID=283909 RepID=R7TNJ3_CAPTE|nr:hypothetical protein CAPTEDRAFT_226270 [Capitella teleta]|eukprot:ELT95428.1 hypothetical protein CAPTEDRAFT_226270 [Capitella teleta]
MVASVEIEHVFKYPIEQVAKTHLNKYPNPMEPRVQNMKTLEHKNDNHQRIYYFRRLIICQNLIPMALRKLNFMNVDNFELEEEGWIDYAKRTMRLKSFCQTFTTYADIRESSVFTTHNSNHNWTVLRQQGSVEIKGLGYFGLIVEAFAQQAMRHGAYQATSIMDTLLKEQATEKISSQGHDSNQYRTNA